MLVGYMYHLNLHETVAVTCILQMGWRHKEVKVTQLESIQHVAAVRLGNAAFRCYFIGILLGFFIGAIQKGDFSASSCQYLGKR